MILTRFRKHGAGWKQQLEKALKAMRGKVEPETFEPVLRRTTVGC